MADTPHISTHVLDTRLGRPAAGLKVLFYRVENNTTELENTTATDEDGRVPQLNSQPLRRGRYRLAFDVAGYAESQGLSPSFFSTMIVEIDVRETGRKYHVPLIISPYSCITYLGS